MRYGVNVGTLGEYADPRLVVDLAGAAEEAGWESLFVWDHLGFTWGVPSGDPWVTLAAVAQATSRLRIGTAVTPLRRCRCSVHACLYGSAARARQRSVVPSAGMAGSSVATVRTGQ